MGPQAVDDLEAITEFIAADSSHYASLFALDALEAVDRLADFPNSGKVVPELDDATLREILFAGYHIIYQVKGDRVDILTVYHGARRLDPSRLR